LDTEHLTREFVARTLPKSEWTHEAHLKVGLWHVLRCPREALDLLRERIRLYNESTGVANTATSGYHETITRLYVVLIADYLAAGDSRRPIDELAQGLLLSIGDRDLPLRYYSRERLFSTEARLSWLAPDLQPLPGTISHA
jgi:hypothetical protein